MRAHLIPLRGKKKKKYEVWHPHSIYFKQKTPRRLNSERRTGRQEAGGEKTNPSLDAARSLFASRENQSWRKFSFGGETTV